MNLDTDTGTDTTDTSTPTTYGPAAAVIALVAEARAAKAAKAAVVDYESDAFFRAQARLTTAYRDLRAYFSARRWGPNGCTFVSRCQEGIGRPYLQTLRIQGRPVATCTEDGWVRLLDESEKLWAGERATSRARHKARMAERKDLIQSLVQHEIHSPRDFAEWFYVDGEKGGYFYRLGRLPVAAIGAMKAADEERNRQFVGSEPRPEDFFDLQEVLFFPRRR